MKNISLIALMIVCTISPVQAADEPWQESYTLEGLGQYAQAIQLVEQLSHKNNGELTWLRLGWLHYLQGGYNDAKQAYIRALDLNPQSIGAHLGVYNVLVAQKRWREAAKHNQETLEIVPRHLQVNLNQMAIEEHNQDWSLLAKRASKMVRYYPTSADALIYLARANAWLGRISLARTAYEKVLMLYPSNQEATYYLSQNK